MNFDCVSTDFIIDEKLKYGIASYDYKENYSSALIISGDDLFLSVFGRLSEKNREKITREDYTYQNIIKILMYYDETGYLLDQFNVIMIMDALTGESDRHFENWGLYCLDGVHYNLLPMYDNSSCLLHQFRDSNIIESTFNKCKMEEYVSKSKCKVSIDGKIYNHFDFIEYLLIHLPNILKQSFIENILKLKSLADSKITEIVNAVPDCFCENTHKKLIIDYIILRRDILLGLVKK